MMNSLRLQKTDEIAHEGFLWGKIENIKAILLFQRIELGEFTGRYLRMRMQSLSNYLIHI